MTKEEIKRIYNARWQYINRMRVLGEGGMAPHPQPTCSAFYVENKATSNEDITVRIVKTGSNVKYSFMLSDNGENWTSASAITSFSVQSGKKKYIKGTINNISSSSYITFSSSDNYAIGGNIMSLTNAEDYEETTTISKDFQFFNLFRGDEKLIDASNLKLPATTLRKYCYRGMFQNCSNLRFAPAELPARIVPERAYISMFYNTAISQTPILRGEELGIYAYSYMFYDCNNLTNISSNLLPASTLNESCYSSMFEECSNLVHAPELPATTLAHSCYYSMFKGCSSLLATPALPARNLAHSCYKLMFADCSKLQESSLLPATTMINACYSGMFLNCS
ncbi:MAG: hypothetical protein HUJ76_11955, partial [Parasporobacterium sp.]|nr:hypothetical protein [Parasporobacterium sp.]